jgi:hypothetical protein
LSSVFLGTYAATLSDDRQRDESGLANYKYAWEQHAAAVINTNDDCFTSRHSHFRVRTKNDGNNKTRLSRNALANDVISSPPSVAAAAAAWVIMVFELSGPQKGDKTNRKHDASGR